MPPALSTLTSAEVAKTLRVDESAVRQWREAGCPHRKVSGRYAFVLHEVVEWRLERARRESRDVAPSTETAERTRKLRADADRAELDLAERRGELVPLDDYQRELDSAFERVRAKLVGLPGEHAIRFPELGMKEATRRLRELSEAILQDLATAEDVDTDEAPDDGADDDEGEA